MISVFYLASSAGTACIAASAGMISGGSSAAVTGRTMAASAAGGASSRFLSVLCAGSGIALRTGLTRTVGMSRAYRSRGKDSSSSWGRSGCPLPENGTAVLTGNAIYRCVRCRHILAEPRGTALRAHVPGDVSVSRMVNHVGIPPKIILCGSTPLLAFSIPKKEKIHNSFEKK